MWVAATLPPESLVARHRIELCPVAFQTTTLPSSSRAVSFGGRCETRTRIARVQAVGNPLIQPPIEYWGETADIRAVTRRDNMTTDGSRCIGDKCKAMNWVENIFIPQPFSSSHQGFVLAALRPKLQHNARYHPHFENHKKSVDERWTKRCGPRPVYVSQFWTGRRPAK